VLGGFITNATRANINSTTAPVWRRTLDGMIAILGPLHRLDVVILVTVFFGVVVLLLMHWLGPPGRRRE
jgi:hypothetical protein